MIARAGLGGSRIAEQGLAGEGIGGGGAVGDDERLSLAGAQGVALDGVGQPPLFRGAEAGEEVGHADRESSVVDPCGQFGGELAGQGKTALDPAAAAAEQAGDGGDREPVVVRQGAHDPRLVHGAGGLRRRVGFEEPRLAHRPRGILDHRGDVRPPIAGPPRQALEAVDDLVGAVGARDHTDRERRE